MKWGAWLDRGGDREFMGTNAWIINGLCIAIALYHVYTFSSGIYEEYIHRSIHVGSILVISLLTYSFSEKKTRRFLVFDLFLVLITLAITAYLVVNTDKLIYERIMLSPESLTPVELIMGAVLILIILEAARRAMGPILGILTLLLMLFAYLGPYLGSYFKHRGFTFSQVLDIAVFSEQGIFSTPIGISATYIIMFLIFAGLLQRSGAADFFTKLALVIGGRAKGGPAKVAIIGSTLVGTITGSAAANVAITGSVTIPMMKKAGFEPHYAGGIEAAAGNGGAIMPPVMAGAAFVVADFAGVSYWRLCIAAFIPALLYYLGIFLQVHLYSVKHNIAAIDRADLPPLGKTLKEGWHHFVPFGLLVGLLAAGYSAIFAALWSLPVVLLASWVRKETRIGIKGILGGLSFAVKVIRVIMLSTALAGILMGMMMVTGLGSRLVSVVGLIAQDSLIIVILISAVVSFILGLALSIIACYILTAILIVPAGIAMGIPPLVAHLFSFYFAMVSSITPPAGAAFFQAAALADAPPFKTGWTATRLAIAAFIVPVFFVYYPSLLFIGDLTHTIAATAVSVVAIACVSVALEGWLMGGLNMLQRFMMIAAAGLLVVIRPVTTGICVLVIAAVVLWQMKKRKGKENQDGR